MNPLPRHLFSPPDQIDYYCDDDGDHPLLMVPTSAADSVRKHLEAGGISCGHRAGDTLGSGAKAPYIFNIGVYSPRLKELIDGWMQVNSVRCEIPADPGDAPRRVTWKYNQKLANPPSNDAG